MSDIFKESFLEGYANTEITLTTVLVSLAITMVIGMYIFLTYRAMTRKTFYSRNFNISLVGVALITAAIIVTIQSSVIVSLGMVGALSIVRFRTAVKDPMDLVYLFWSIATGIICGAGFAEYAVLLALAVTLALVVLSKLPTAKAPMILIVNTSDIDSEAAILEIVNRYARSSSVNSRNMTKTSLDMTFELRVEDGSSLIRELAALDGVVCANLMSHDGEVTF